MHHRVHGEAFGKLVCWPLFLEKKNSKKGSPAGGRGLSKKNTETWMPLNRVPERSEKHRLKRPTTRSPMADTREHQNINQTNERKCTRHSQARLTVAHSSTWKSKKSEDVSPDQLSYLLYVTAVSYKLLLSDY